MMMLWYGAHCRVWQNQSGGCKSPGSPEHLTTGMETSDRSLSESTQQISNRVWNCIFL